MTPHPRQAHCPSATALEAFVAGEPLGAAFETHVPGCEGCSAYVQALRVEQAAFFAARPVERFLEQSQARRRPALRWWWWWLVPVGVALTVAVVMVVPPAPPPVVFKGRSFTVVARRAGVPTPLPVVPDMLLQPGDSLRFSFRAARDGWVAVLNLDGRGQARVFFPFDGEKAVSRAAADDTFFPGAVELDDAPGKEWLIAVFDPSPFALEGLLEQLRATPPGQAPSLRCGSCILEVLQVQKSP